VRADQANLRAALELSLAESDTRACGLRIAADLWPWWIGSGLPAEGRRWLGRLIADDGAPPSPERAQALWTHGFLSAVDDDTAEARTLLARCRESALVLGDAASAAHALSTLGVADLFDGQVEEACVHLEAGIAAERLVPGSAPYLADALINLGLAYCYRGDLVAAREVLAEAGELCAEHGEVLLSSWALTFQALAALLGGRTDEAVALGRASLERKREIGNGQGVVWAVELVAWAAVEQGEVARAAVLLGACEARAEEFEPPFHGFPGMVEWHRHCVARAGEALGAAALAAAFDRGSRLSIEELTAAVLDEAADGQHQAADDAALGEPPLTPREREIAQLVATGRTNREIADSLVISPRTVDTHVQRILTKLDFTSRHQVVALLAGRNTIVT
jgi:DNA-binding CsgD family transcriptional regulator